MWNNCKIYFEKIKMKKQNLKIILFRVLFRILYIFPIRKVIFFSSYEGKQYSCNPKYIFQSMYSDKFFFTYRYIWEKNDENKIKNYEKVKLVKHNSFRYIFSIMTSKIIITNSGLNPIFPLRKKQILINTWHGGGAYKRVGRDIDENTNGTSYYGLKKASEQTTFFISSSELFTNIMSNSIELEKEKFLKIGMPRNDIFFNKNMVNSFYFKIRDKFNLSNDDKIVLYAPTFRGNTNSISKKNIDNLDYEKLLKLQNDKFKGNWKILYRGHYSLKGEYNNNNKNIIDASNYPDMQELLCASDILITDYSSSIWDFSFLERPCFLYVPDLIDYKLERNFYTNINSWPAILIENNEDLDKVINNFNKENLIQKIKEHYKMLGSYENGEATTELINTIKKEILNGK